MPDREKVIKDIEECLSASCRGFRPRQLCPYNDKEWDIMRDALALMKEQQPRVLTYKQAKELKDGTDIWMECKKDSTVLPFKFKSFTQGYTYKWFNFYGIETQSVKAMLYGSSVRFWTAKPSDEQRKVAPWETN